MQWEIFAVFYPHVSLDYIKTNLSGDELTALAQEAVNQSIYDYGVTVRPDDKILDRVGVVGKVAAVHILLFALGPAQVLHIVHPLQNAVVDVGVRDTQPCDGIRLLRFDPREFAGNLCGFDRPLLDLHRHLRGCKEHSEIKDFLLRYHAGQVGRLELDRVVVALEDDRLFGVFFQLRKDVRVDTRVFVDRNEDHVDRVRADDARLPARHHRL